LHIHFSDLHRGVMPYDPAALWQDDPLLMERLSALSLRDRQAIAEIARGDLTRHSFYATLRADREAPYGDVDSIPRIPWETHQPKGPDFAAIIERQSEERFVLQHAGSGLSCAMERSALAAAIFRELDGERTFREIFSRARQDPRYSGANDEAFLAAFKPWFETLASIERMALLRSANAWPAFKASAPP